jgi:DNA-binding response OmpR family regulator
LHFLELTMPHKVILAEASPSIQKVIQMAFPEPEFEVHTIEDGLQAIASLAQINPDAVLLSLALPSRDGYEVGRYLRSREEFRKAGLVLLKNAFEPVDSERLRGLDYDEIVQKPFDSESLARLVREIIDRKKTPHSFPEEALIEDAPAEDVIPLFKEKEFVPPPLSSRPEDEVEDKVRNMLRDEILSVERELEKRLKASLRAEFMEWLDREKKQR